MRYEHDCFVIFTAHMCRQRLFDVMLYPNSSPSHSNLGGGGLPIVNDNYVAILYDCIDVYVECT